MKLKNISHSTLVKLLELTKEVHSFIESEECILSALNNASHMLGTELGSIMLLDEKSKELLIRKALGISGDITKTTRVKIGDGIAGWVAKTGKPLLIQDLSRSSRFKQYKKKDTNKYQTDSLLSVPLKISNHVIGVINVNNKKTKRIFTKKDLNLLIFISEHISLAIQNALAYETVKRLADMKLDFVSNISHELKNPLGVIKNSISIILDGLAGAVSKKKRYILEIAVKNIDRLNRLLDSLLDLAKLEARKGATKRTYFDIKKLVADCIVFISPSAKQHSIKIRLDSSLRYAKIWADHDRLTQIINNLLSNAIKFIPKGGHISVKISQKQNNVLVSVQDSGVGIKKKDIPKLFNKFERLDVTEKEIKGTGLGLAICKEIIDIHEGRIWAESRLGKGSKFNILLPRDLRRDKK